MFRRHFVAIAFVAVCAAWVGLALQAHAAGAQPSGFGIIATAPHG